MKPTVSFLLVAGHLLAHVVVPTTAYASWLPCYVDLDETEVVMNQRILPAEMASTLLAIEVREEDAKAWSTTAVIPAGRAGSYEARLVIPANAPATVQFVMEVSAGGSFGEEEGMCQGQRIHGAGSQSVGFDVDGTADVTLVVSSSENETAFSHQHQRLLVASIIPCLLSSSLVSL
jgi:hypothetical protein